MSHIDIQRAHTMGCEEARAKVATIEPKLRDKYGINISWDGNTAKFTGTGVTGSLKVEDALVVLNLKLGLMLRPFAGKIREAIERSIDKALG